MLKATQEDLRLWQPCWDADRLNKYLSNRPQKFTALDVLVDWPDLTARDRLWVVLRPEMIPMRILQEFAIDCVEYVPQKDPRMVSALQVARAFLRGETSSEELRKARDAAYNAAKPVMTHSDVRAAYAADAVYATASTEYVRATACVRAAAYADEREWQVSRLSGLLREAENLIRHEGGTTASG